MTSEQNKRRAKSDAEKKKRGEIRLSIWLTPDASKKLLAIEKQNGDKDRRDIVSEAILSAPD